MPNSQPKIIEQSRNWEEIRTLAEAALKDRIATKPLPIDNALLPAGSQMHFYCRICGIKTDVLPETFLGRPRKICTECQFMVKMNFIREDETTTMSGTASAPMASKITVVGLIKEMNTEDGGMALIAPNLEEEVIVGGDDCFFFRLQSWDDSAKHSTLRSLMGRRIKITLEVLE